MARQAHFRQSPAPWARALAALFAILLATGPARAAETWEPIPPADLAATASTVTPDADSEYLFWRCALEDELEDVTFKYHVRAKIYTTRGVENAGKLSIDRGSQSKLLRLSARIVKPDGTSIELKKSDFLESEVAKLGSYKVRRTSFAFPSLAPGDIVEYRWRVSTEGGNPVGYYFCQQSVPVRDYSLEIAARFAGMQITWFNAPTAESVKLGDTRVKIVARNLPAFVEEPQMPPELDCRGWIRLTYTGEERDLVKQWQDFSREAAEDFARMTKPNDAIRKKATELAAGARTPEEIVQRIDEFCRTQLLNLSWSDAPAARDERQSKKTRERQNARETLQRGRGWPWEIDLVFASLLQAAGRDTRLALNAPTYKLLNTQIPQGWVFMTESHIAVRNGEGWTFHSPGDVREGFGMCNAYDENARAMIVDAKKPLFSTIPASPARLSAVNRKGRFTLSADGTLQGSVEVVYTGHEASWKRLDAWDQSQEETDRKLSEGITARIPGAEVSAIQWENLRPQTGPVTLRYQVTVPGYAENAGQRLVLVPGYFARGRTPVFTAPERKQRLQWSHAWTEADDIEIAIPADWEIEQATLPPPFPESSGTMTAKHEIAFSRRRNAVLFKRQFEFTGALGLLFGPENYEGFKPLFESLHRNDQHSIVLRPKPAAAPVTAADSTAATPKAQP